MPSETTLPQTTGLHHGVEPLVCVIDDETAIRQSLCRLFRSARFPVRSFASAAEYLEQQCHTGPCCIVLDVRMPEADGFTLQQSIAGRTEQIVFLTGHGDVPMCARAMKAGAIDFLTKPVDDEILLEAVSRALTRSSQILADLTERAAARAKIARLTPRESAVMRRVVEGMLNKHIAADLAIAEKTVKVHRGRMMRKAGVVSVPELIKLVHASGIHGPAQRKDGP